jgi:hypothetical protein
MFIIPFDDRTDAVNIEDTVLVCPELNSAPCVQVFFCFTQSVASTRWLIQDEMHIANTQVCPVTNALESCTVSHSPVSGSHATSVSEQADPYGQPRHRALLLRPQQLCTPQHSW